MLETTEASGNFDKIDNPVNKTTGTPPLTLFFETLKNRVSRKPCC